MDNVSEINYLIFTITFVLWQPERMQLIEKIIH